MNWRKSSFSNPSGNSVEVDMTTPGTIRVRDSKRPGQEPLSYDHDEWAAFIAGVKAGEFDL